MKAVAELFIRLACVVTAFCFYILILSLLMAPLSEAIFAWPLIVLMAMYVGWHGVLTLTAVSLLIGLLTARWPSKRGSRAYRDIAGIGGDLTSGILISAIFYTKDEFMLFSGCAVTVLFACLYHFLVRMRDRRTLRSGTPNTPK